VKYETPQIKDFGSIAEHTFQSSKDLLVTAAWREVDEPS